MERVSKYREILAFGRLVDWETEARCGTVWFGITEARQFPSLSPDTVRNLISNGSLDPNSTQNKSPKAKRLLEFAEYLGSEYHDRINVGLVGYMISPYRKHPRITIEGLGVRSTFPLPSGIRSEIESVFTPDLIDENKFKLQASWD